MAWRAGIRTMSVTDHDTVASGCGSRQHWRATPELPFVPGIRITAVHEAATSICLATSWIRTTPRSGNFSNASGPRSHPAAGREMVDRLAEIGKPINREKVLAKKEAGGSLGRPDGGRAAREGRPRGRYAPGLRQGSSEGKTGGRAAAWARTPSLKWWASARKGGRKCARWRIPASCSGMISFRNGNRSSRRVEAFHSDRPANHGALPVAGGTLRHSRVGRFKFITASQIQKVGLPARSDCLPNALETLVRRAGGGKRPEMAAALSHSRAGVSRQAWAPRSILG